MAYQDELNQVGQMITDLIKATIQEKGLVDTGTLLNSISTVVELNYDSGAMQIKVTGEDYFKYLDNKNNIVNDAFNSPSFTQIEEKISDAYVSYLTEKIEIK